MGLLDTILSTIDAKKRSAKRGIMDMLDNPQQWAGMQSNRIQEDRYGGAENAQAMKQYLSKQPYDKKALTAANDALRNAAINESLGAIFVGKGAKTWDKMKEADAMARLAKGEDAATVWKETGVGVAPWDKKARAEISDHAAKLTPISELVKQRNADLIAQRDKIVANVKEAGRSPTDFEKARVNQLNELIQTSAYRGTVGDALDHPELFAAHPELKGQDFRWRELPSGESGSWDQNSGMMLNQGLFGNNAKSIVLHEGQHGSQDYSKLAKGGNTSSFEDLNKSIKNTQTRQESQLEALARADQNGGIDPVSGFDRERIRENLKLIGNQRAEFMAKEGAGLDPYEAYKRLAGEAEARLTQYRMNLTPEARAALYPYDPTYFKQATGVDIDKLITRGLLDDGPAMSVAPKLTEFEQRHLIAQKNAALPVEQGGLGLPLNNTAMDRARAIGFDTPAYHGTNADIKAFDLSKSGSASGTEQYGSGIYTASNPLVASGYVNTTKEGGNVMPLMLNMQSPLTPELEQKLTKKQIKDLISKSPELDYSLNNFGDVEYYGRNKVFNDAVNRVYDFQQEKLLDTLHPISGDFFNSNPQAFNDAASNVLKKDGVKVNFDTGDQFNVAWNPNQLRSRFAAFDPMRRHEADLLGYADPYLLGAMGAGGLLGMGGYSMMNDK